jgi:predicted methyltransferase
MRGPLLTIDVHERLLTARDKKAIEVECSLDLDRTKTRVQVHASEWEWEGTRYPYLDRCKDRTIYYWSGESFEPASRYDTSLIKLVPTEWGAPTFEIDGIKMLPTLRVSPYEDAREKVELIQPRGKTILDTCGGLGYFAAWCLELGAAAIVSYERSASVIWLRHLNPWSPEGSGTADARLTLMEGDVLERIGSHANRSFDAILHDPPRFGIAGDLYSQQFYDELARVLKRKGKLFHYVGTPNKLTTGRDVPGEVAKRLQRAGFRTRMIGDGILASL